jgi:hypothetical protein
MSKKQKNTGLITSPNVWTPVIEDLWLKESAKDLIRLFPPISKPRHISLISKRKGRL